MAEMKNYKIINNAISKELAGFIYDYFLIKRRVARKLFDDGYISPDTPDFGVWTDKQIPNTYSHYADIVMETLLEKIKPVMEENTGLKVLPTYTYARIYKKGDILKRHKDRPSCEISTTINLGGDSWPIYLEPSGEKGKEGVKVNLNPGDMLIYRGCELEHWREAFEGDNCGQVFLHYNEANSPEGQKNIYDGRPFIGLPQQYKKKL
mgnify:FL=1|jgi:hypothetical protein|tara:strand:+ start:239 stop:859 length:621 start_codon:yes stop_codon:yes gene_type:complete